MCVHTYVQFGIKVELGGLIAVVAMWLSVLWWLQSDTLGSSPAVAVFSPFSLSGLDSNETSIMFSSVHFLVTLSGSS